MSSELESKVKIVNAVNIVANNLQLLLQKFFMPYIGHKIFKGDGSLLQKIEKHPELLLISNCSVDPRPLLKQIEANEPLFKRSDEVITVFHKRSEHSLSYEVHGYVKHEMSGKVHAIYHSRIVMIADVNDGVLMNMRKLFEYPVSINVKDIEVKKKELEELKEKVEELQQELRAFI